MPKKILIVESDARLSSSIRSELESKGFTVEETTDGKGAVDRIRQTRPELVVLAVDLSAGQNGYIICGKLKKDDEVKSIPVVIIGNPDGFAQHKKLKTRADEYLPKSGGQIDAKKLVEVAGGLIGFPEPPAQEDVVSDESISLSDLVDEDEDSQPARTAEFNAHEEIAVEKEEVVAGDPELDMLDAAFDDMSEDGSKGAESSSSESESASASSEDEPPPAPIEEEVVSGLEAIEETPLQDAGADADDKTQIGFSMDEVKARLDAQKATSKQPSLSRPPVGGADASEARELRTKVTELTSALEDEKTRANEHESKVRELETQLENVRTELEAAKASGAGGGSRDKEFFALKEARTKQDKEILRLKNELNEKEKELLEIREHETQLEQQQSDSSGEVARREAQIKTLTARADQLASERKKLDQQLMAVKEESRSASAKLATMTADLDAANERLTSVEAELEELRGRANEFESAANRAREENDELRRELDETKEKLETARREADENRTQLETAQIDLDSAKTQLTAQATAFAEEAAALRKRISEMEDASNKHEERVSKLYGRIKGHEKVNEKTKKALSIAMQLLEESANAEELAEDEDEAAAG